MIDFKNGTVFKLKQTQNTEGEALINALLVSNESVVSTYKTVRDMVIFTNKRIICVNVQGMTGAKKDFTSMPYSKIQVFSIETAGTFEKFKNKFTADTELELYFSGLGKVKFEFKGDSDIVSIGKLISDYALN